MVTAFQRDAFQDNAFQIAAAAATRDGSPWRKSRAQRRHEQMLREDQELIQILKTLMPIIERDRG